MSASISGAVRAGFARQNEAHSLAIKPRQRESLEHHVGVVPLVAGGRMHEVGDIGVDGDSLDEERVDAGGDDPRNDA